MTWFLKKRLGIGSKDPSCFNSHRDKHEHVLLQLLQPSMLPTPNKNGQGSLTSQTGVQQGDPLGPFMFALVLQKMVTTIHTDEACAGLLQNAWYLDDGSMAGESSSVLRALTIIQAQTSNQPNMEILGAPIGDAEFCRQFFASKHQAALALLSTINDLGCKDPQVALALLRLCSSFCKLAHIARTTPPHLILSSMEKFDIDVHRSFAECTGCDVPDSAWRQAHLGLHLDPIEFQTAVKWWLEVNPSFSSDGNPMVCPLCPNCALDPLGYHCVTCKSGGDVTTRHNTLRNVVHSTFQQAGLSAHLEVGCGWEKDNARTRPADILVTNWDCGTSAAFDITVTSPLNSPNMLEAGMYQGVSATLEEASASAGAAARIVETQKHSANDSKCQELGWVCTPLAVESYGNWGMEVHSVFKCLVSLIAIHQSCPKASVSAELYGHLNLSLVRSAARAILGREPMGVGGHHALTCKHGGDVVSRHNRLRDVLLESCRLACLGPQVEAGSGLGHEGHRTRPADILIPHWDLGKPAALDRTVTSTLNSSTLMEAGVTSGSAALAAEVHKHNANNAKCSELGWTCHHAVTCKRGGDAISRHNKLRDVVLQTCHRACISAKAEAGSGLGHELRNTRPADILASNWLCGKPAAFDLTVVSPLNPTFISEAGRTAGSAAVAAELRKHSANDAKCSELGWTCIPLVAESYGAWGSEAVQAFSRLASYLATRTNSPKSSAACMAALI
ncbi:hypothetical protein EMCRGX_G025366 [Ephydatia muelleri]